MEQTARENKMGTMPINKLLITMSLPMMASMMVQALYNIVDSMFVSWLSENALTAVSLAFPVQNLMIAVATGTGVGVNALLSKSLGEKNQKLADKTANVSLFLAVASSVLFVLFGIFGSRIYFEMQTDIQEIIEYGVQYTSVVCILSIGLMVAIMAERLLASTGRTMFTMITQTTGAVINMILDPILIFGYFGVPAMGVTGAALATVIGQMGAMGLGIFFNLRYNRDIHLSLREMLPEKFVVKRIYGVGIPSIVMASISSIMNFGMNRILLSFVSTASAVFGVYFKVQSFIFMPIFGLNNGMVPIVAYNYGAKNKKRILETVRLSTIYATTMMVLGFLAFQLFPQVLLGLFNASEQMQAIGQPALRIISVSFLLAGYCIVTGSTFQALGRSMYGLAISVLRQLAVLLPAAYLLAQFGNLDLVWLAFPIAELFSFTGSWCLKRKILGTIPD